MVKRLQRTLQLLEMVAKRPCAVNIKGSAMLADERLNLDAIAMEPAPDVAEIVHAVMLKPDP